MKKILDTSLLKILKYKPKNPILYKLYYILYALIIIIIKRYNISNNNNYLLYNK